MPKIAYVERNFRADTLKLIDIANRIITDYERQGYDLTLRQLFYQLVSRDIIPNKQSEYDRLGSIINDARLAGLIDWNRIVDRTRNLKGLNHFKDPAAVVDAARYSFKLDRWANQEHRVEVWVEKDALVGVISRACNALDVPFFSCRGYTSQSEMWVASQRLLRTIKEKKTPIILHLGDHDPSGIDMTRDIFDRLDLFMGGVKVERLALNMDQVEHYNPPPNSAKQTDSRAVAYIESFGYESWELDALEPTVIGSLITDAINKYRDEDLWKEIEDEEKEGKRLLQSAVDRWEEISDLLGEDDDYENEGEE